MSINGGTNSGPLANRNRDRFRSPRRGVADIVDAAKQEYLVVYPRSKFDCFIGYFANLLNNVDGDQYQLPQTIVFTSVNGQAAHLSMALRINLELDVIVLPEHATDEEIRGYFDQIFNKKKAPILIFGEKYFMDDVKDVDIVINYDLPPNVESYRARLQHIYHKKCITYVSSFADRALLRQIMNACETSGVDPPKNLQAVFEFDYGALRDKLNTSDTTKSWVDLLEE